MMSALTRSRSEQHEAPAGSVGDTSTLATVRVTIRSGDYLTQRTFEDAATFEASDSEGLLVDLQPCGFADIYALVTLLTIITLAPRTGACQGGRRAGRRCFLRALATPRDRGLHPLVRRNNRPLIHDR